MTAQHYIAIAFAVVMFGWLFWPAISGAFASLFRPKSYDLDPAQEETLDVAAMHRLKARFARIGCKEGQDAMKVVAQHFFHDEGHA